MVAAVTGLAASEINLTILHTSDEHSNLMPAPLVDYFPDHEDSAPGGFARLATLVRQTRATRKTEPVLLLSSGDFIGGTPFSWLILNNRSPEIDIMRKLGYVATTFGNHEFDYGPDTFVSYFLRNRQASSSMSLLSSNIVIPPQHPFNSLPVRKNLITTLPGGLKLGIFALLGKGAHRLSPAAKPLDFADQIACARREVAELKAAGAGIIVALTHSGFNEDRDLANAVPEISLILGGHDHIQTSPPQMAGNTIIMHSGHYLRTVGQLDLAWDTATRRLRLRNSETGAPFIHLLDSRIPEDPEIAEIISDHLQELNDFVRNFTGGDFPDMRQIIARSDFALEKHQMVRESAVGNYIADAMRLAAEKVTGDKVHFAFHANGIIRGNITPGTIGESKGKISFFDLATLSGLGSGPDGKPGYPLVSIYLTGAEVLNLLEIAALLPLLWGDVYFLQVSGLRYSYDPARAYWLWLPIINKPLPACRAILAAARFDGEGLQRPGSDTPLLADDKTLYHIVTTHYLGTYLPMISQKLPQLKLVLKNRQGQPVDLAKTIIYNGNREFKLWEAVARHTISLASHSGEIARIPDYYRQTGNRIVVSRGLSLWFWPAVTALLLSMAVALIYRRRQKP